MSDQVKIVVIGDGAVGKTCLLISYVNNEFPRQYVPTVFDNYAINTVVDKKTYSVTLWDTAGQEDFDRLRPLSYPGTDIFLICIAVITPLSLTNAKLKWRSEVQHHCPQTQYMLVGLKTDLRGTSSEVISREDCMAAAREMGAIDYVECSAQLQEGVANVFETAVRHVVAARSGKPSQTAIQASGNTNQTPQKRRGICTLL